MLEVQRHAMSMMAASGFDNVTVEQIAARAGVSPSTVYRYFGTKEALVLWGDRAADFVGRVAEAKVGKKRTVAQAFTEAAAAVYDDADVLAQLELVFANEALAIAFEHELVGSRHALATALAVHRGAEGVGGRDLAAAGALLGSLVAVLERWQSTGGTKSFVKQLARVADSVA